MSSAPLHRPSTPLAAICAAIGMLPAIAGAMVVDCGPTICYRYDETQAGVGVFGLPTRVGDSMQFLPPAMMVMSTSGSVVPDVAASFVFDRVYTVSGADIAALRVAAEGDYEIIGNGSVGGQAKLEAEGNVSAEQLVAADVFAHSGDSGAAQLWALQTSASPGAAFAGPAGDVGLTITNLLQAASAGLGDLAWSQTKFLEVSAAVPLPAAGALFATALALGGGFARRRRERRPG
ncbi:MAG: hypothetical protein L6Q83_03145 [Gammaproteobacteria bacterium]|nr:hypothetical protein [Gammaproteobacteria bacterium]